MSADNALADLRISSFPPRKNRAPVRDILVDRERNRGGGARSPITLCA